MYELLLEDFELFFLGLPKNVQDDLSFMMVVLCDESLVVREVAEVYERASRGLFGAKSRIGRIGNLISAVAIADVYFAMDVHNRFAAEKGRPRRRREGDEKAETSRGPYAREIHAIETAKQRWLELRATRFTPAAIAAALIPSAPQKSKRRFSRSPQAQQSEAREARLGTLS